MWYVSFAINSPIGEGSSWRMTVGSRARSLRGRQASISNRKENASYVRHLQILLLPERQRSFLLFWMRTESGARVSGSRAARISIAV